MVAVNTKDAIMYGFRLLGYLLAVFVLGGILIGIGAAFTPGPFSRGNPILSVIFVLAGIAVMYAGGLGLLYKVVGDGVEVGNRAAEGGTQSRPMQKPAGQRQGGQPPGGQP
jgi:hypothetical protein